MCLTLMLVACLQGRALADENLSALLRTQHAELAPALARSDFGRPLLMASRQGQGRVEGVVHAVVDAPLSQVRALARPERWCEVLMLHQTTRRCEAEGRELALEMSSKSGQWREGVALRLAFAAPAQQTDLLSVRISAEHGPLGTRDYLFTLQAVPVSARQSYLNFRYSYRHGVMANLAMQSYLNTWGRHKVGFTRLPVQPGQPAQYVGGMRGVMERNTMRYFLAIEAVLQTLNLPASQMQRRLESWFEATEQYPLQLHEMEREEYLTLKRAQMGLTP